MSDVSMFPTYLVTKFKRLEERKQIQKKDRGTWYQERPAVGPNRPKRGKDNSW